MGHRTTRRLSRESDEVWRYAPGGELRDSKDDARIRQGRDRHGGFKVGTYLQPPPLLFTRDRHNLWLGDHFKDAPIFALMGGPSFKHVNHDLLRQRGITTVMVNNGPATFRPDLWVCVDNPANFLLSTWLDPSIMKFAPICHSEKELFDSVAWKKTKVKVGDCPNVAYYSRNEQFNHEQFLWEDTVNWGCHGEHKGSCGHAGCRSVMLAMMRILHYVGFREVYLVGADFKMVEGADNYHFKQARSEGSIKNNNKTYAALNDRFDLLQPLFLKEGFNVYNCTPESGLKSFPFIPLEEAVLSVASRVPRDRTCTEGLYDRKANEEKAQKEKEKQRVKESILPSNSISLSDLKIRKGDQ